MATYNGKLIKHGLAWRVRPLALMYKFIVPGLAAMLLAGCGSCDIMDSSSSNSLACAPALAVSVLALPARPLMDAREQQQFRSRRPVWKLTEPKRFGELELPAGAVVYLYLSAPQDHDKVTQEDMDEIQLPGDMTWRGATLDGHLQRAEHAHTYWQARLTKSQPVQGWPCARGDATLWNDGSLRGCRLAADYRVSGTLEAEPKAAPHLVPAGSQILVFAHAVQYTTAGGHEVRLETSAPGSRQD